MKRKERIKRSGIAAAMILAMALAGCGGKAGSTSAPVPGGMEARKQDTAEGDAAKADVAEEDVTKTDTERPDAAGEDVTKADAVKTDVRKTDTAKGSDVSDPGHGYQEEPEGYEAGEKDARNKGETGKSVDGNSGAADSPAGISGRGRHLPVIMEIKAPVQEGPRITLALYSNSTDDYLWEEKFALFRQQGPKEEQVPFDENYGWIEVAYILGKGQTGKQNIDLGTAFGELDPGVYRLEKMLDNDRTGKRFLASVSFRYDGKIVEMVEDAADIAALSLVDAMLPSYPAFASREEVAGRAGASVEEQEGTCAGSPAQWSIVEDGSFVYFYYRYTGEGSSAGGKNGSNSGGGTGGENDSKNGGGARSENVSKSGRGTWEYSNYAVIGEDTALACGIHPGMTRTQAQELVPGLYEYHWDNPGTPSPYDWNPGAYPDGWCEQFPTILVARVENEADTPYCVGFMVDEEDVIRAMTFSWINGG